ncbi:hypothetical protein FRX31_033432, partial [Thalictrum thalictroides]
MTHNQEDQIEKLLEQDDMIWRQKARLKWDHLGERCTGYFFLLNKIRQSKATIKEMKGDNGETIRDPKQIGDFI